MHLFGDIIRWVILMKNKEKEDKLMAVLSKPINLSFELDPKKAKKFLEDTDRSALKRALDRSSQKEIWNKSKSQK
jgi:hypothetical protein